MKRPLIVGFDPGTTAALAILDTNGELVYLHSKKGYKKSEILDDITARGKPLIVAADRNPLPKSVGKLASILGSKIYYPVKSLMTSEKAMLIKNFKLKMKNDHERDAIASAYRAYKYYLDLFNRTKKVLDEASLSKYFPEVIERVVGEEEDNINDAIERVMTEKRTEKKNTGKGKSEIKVIDRNYSKISEHLKQELRRKENDISILRKYNEELKHRLNDANNTLEFYREKISGSESSGIKAVRDDKRRIEQSLVKMKKLRDIELKGYLPIIEIENMKSDILNKTHSSIDLKKRLVFCIDSSNAQMLNDYDILALITTKKPDEKIFEKINFPVILEKDISIGKKDDYRFVGFVEFERALKIAKKEGLIEWLETYRRRRL